MLRLPAIPLKTALPLLLLMLAAAALAAVARPRQLAAAAQVPTLSATVPKAFGDWTLLPSEGAQVSVSQGVESEYEQPYDQTLMRSYVNRKGERVMLALAWGQRQRQDVKVHRPEVCYPAQGYKILSQSAGQPLAMPGLRAPVPTVDLLADSRGGFEAVHYWIRIGDSYGGDGLKARWYILTEGLQGRVPDGILVRASQRIASREQLPQAQATMNEFLLALSQALPPSTRALLLR